jgi:hypothetical protein
MVVSRYGPLSLTLRNTVGLISPTKICSAKNRDATSHIFPFQEIILSHFTNRQLEQHAKVGKIHYSKFIFICGLIFLRLSESYFFCTDISGWGTGRAAPQLHSSATKIITHVKKSKQTSRLGFDFKAQKIVCWF